MSYKTFDNGRWVCTNQPERSHVLIFVNVPTCRFVLPIKDSQPQDDRMGQMLNLVSGKIAPVSIITSDTGIVLESNETASGPFSFFSQRAGN